MRGSLSSPYYLMRTPTLALQLEKTHKIPPLDGITDSIDVSLSEL